jgi:serine/threonine-protein kinase
MLRTVHDTATPHVPDMPGRYTILKSIAKGGMATVYLGRASGSAGFSRVVAIKRLHPHLAADAETVRLLVEEARLAAQIRHNNIVSTLDFVVSEGAFSLVLEYIEGDSLSALVRRAGKLGEAVPRPIALAILYGVLRGLDAAHEARNENGQPLGIVHRDVSPQNVLVGIDGIPRVIDFGIAKAAGQYDSTRPGELRGKFSYMAPEQMLARPVTRQVDVYAAGVVLWELLAGQRLFTGDDSRVVCARVLDGAIPLPSTVAPEIPPELDAVVARATARDVSDRYLTARELLSALEGFESASDDDVAAWVRRLAAPQLAERQRILQSSVPPADQPSVRDLADDLARGDLARDSHAPPLVTPLVETPVPSVAPLRKRRWVLGGALALVAIVLTIVGVRGSRTSTGSETAVAPPELAASEPTPIAPAPPVTSASAALAATVAVELPAPSTHASPAKPLRKPLRQRASSDPRSYR